jgi:hypothetical protein
MLRTPDFVREYREYCINNNSLFADNVAAFCDYDNYRIVIDDSMYSEYKVIHEVVHYFDIVDFESNINVEDEFLIEKYKVFTLWSEYHAYFIEIISEIYHKAIFSNASKVNKSEHILNYYNSFLRELVADSNKATDIEVFYYHLFRTFGFISCMKSLFKRGDITFEVKVTDYTDKLKLDCCQTLENLFNCVSDKMDYCLVADNLLDIFNMFSRIESGFIDVRIETFTK